MNDKLENKEIVPIYKPKGWPSFKIITELRKITGIKKIGFLGTLDPAAEGVLVVGIGKGTKKLKDLDKNKEYLAQIAFGIESNTWDLETKNIKFTKVQKITKEKLKKALGNFKGKINQVIPMFSAKQIRGQRLYKLARAGKILKKLPQKEVEIYKIELLGFSEKEVLNHILPVAEIKVSCSMGTFIRSLAYELGEKLDTKATLISLVRTRDGGFGIKDTIKISNRKQ